MTEFVRTQWSFAILLLIFFCITHECHECVIAQEYVRDKHNVEKFSHDHVLLRENLKSGAHFNENLYDKRREEDELPFYEDVGANDFHEEVWEPVYVANGDEDAFGHEPRYHLDNLHSEPNFLYNNNNYNNRSKHHNKFYSPKEHNAGLATNDDDDNDEQQDEEDDDNSDENVYHDYRHSLDYDRAWENDGIRAEEMLQRLFAHCKQSAYNGIYYNNIREQSQERQDETKTGRLENGDASESTSTINVNRGRSDGFVSSSCLSNSNVFTHEARARLRFVLRLLNESEEQNRLFYSNNTNTNETTLMKNCSNNNNNGGVSCENDKRTVQWSKESHKTGTNNSIDSSNKNNNNNNDGDDHVHVNATSLKANLQCTWWRHVVHEYKPTQPYNNSIYPTLRELLVQMQAAYATEKCAKMNRLQEEEELEEEQKYSQHTSNVGKTQKSERMEKEVERSMEWVKDLHYLTIMPIEKALRQIQHEDGNNETILSLFYAPDLFPDVNYIHWLRAMTCLAKMLQRESIERRNNTFHFEMDSRKKRHSANAATFFNYTTRSWLNMHNLQRELHIRTTNFNKSVSSNSDYDENTRNDYVEVKRKQRKQKEEEKEVIYSSCEDIFINGRSYQSELLKIQEAQRQGKLHLKIVVYDAYYPPRHSSDALLKVLGTDTYSRTSIAHNKWGSNENSEEIDDVAALYDDNVKYYRNSNSNSNDGATRSYDIANRKLHRRHRNYNDIIRWNVNNEDINNEDNNNNDEFDNTKTMTDAHSYITIHSSATKQTSTSNENKREDFMHKSMKGDNVRLNESLEEWELWSKAFIYERRALLHMVLLESGLLSITNNVFSMTNLLHSISGADQIISSKALHKESRYKTSNSVNRVREDQIQFFGRLLLEFARDNTLTPEQIMLGLYNVYDRLRARESRLAHKLLSHSQLTKYMCNAKCVKHAQDWNYTSCININNNNDKNYTTLDELQMPLHTCYYNSSNDELDTHSIVPLILFPRHYGSKPRLLESVSYARHRREFAKVQQTTATSKISSFSSSASPSTSVDHEQHNDQSKNNQDNSFCFTPSLQHAFEYTRQQAPLFYVIDENDNPFTRMAHYIEEETRKKKKKEGEEQLWKRETELYSMNVTYESLVDKKAENDNNDDDDDDDDEDDHNVSKITTASEHTDVFVLECSSHFTATVCQALLNDIIVIANPTTTLSSSDAEELSYNERYEIDYKWRHDLWTKTPHYAINNTIHNEVNESAANPYSIALLPFTDSPFPVHNTQQHYKSVFYPSFTQQRWGSKRNIKAIRSENDEEKGESEIADNVANITQESTHPSYISHVSDNNQEVKESNTKENERMYKLEESSKAHLTSGKAVYINAMVERSTSSSSSKSFTSPFHFTTSTYFSESELSKSEKEEKQKEALSVEAVEKECKSNNVIEGDKHEEDEYAQFVNIYDEVNSELDEYYFFEVSDEFKINITKFAHTVPLTLSLFLRTPQLEIFSKIIQPLTEFRNNMTRELLSMIANEANKWFENKMTKAYLQTYSNDNVQVQWDAEAMFSESMHNLRELFDDAFRMDNVTLQSNCIIQEQSKNQCVITLMQYLLSNRNALVEFAAHPYNIARLHTIDRLAQYEAMQRRVKLLQQTATERDLREYFVLKLKEDAQEMNNILSKLHRKNNI